MRHVVAGTAGHIDHGKSSLVLALTGIDPDRLKEEKERGITIDIGFAHLDLGDGLTLGIVDVPGHERFVKNMLAGVGGIDLVMLIIAADEGVMPQTREHLAICQLLRIPSGLVVLTKADLAEPEWLELVQEDVRGFLRGTFLDGAPILPVSAKTGQGLPALREALTALARAVPSARDRCHLPPADRPRLHDPGVRHGGDRHGGGRPAHPGRAGRGVPPRAPGQGARASRPTASPSRRPWPASARP